jgi:hypothetical protein
MGRRGAEVTATQEKKIFTYEEAAALLPAVQQITAGAVAAVDGLATNEDEEAVDVVAFNQIIGEWAEQILDLGIEIKGLWLVDFDSGSGYYCWQYPEPSLQHFHGYEEGFGGRVKLQ